MTIPQAYFELAQRQIDIARTFAMAWVDVASSVSMAALARTASPAAPVPDPWPQHPNVDDIFEEIVELMVAEDLTATAR